MHDGAAGGWLWERKRCRKSVLHAYEGDFFASASVDTLCSTPAREQSTAQTRRRASDSKTADGRRRAIRRWRSGGGARDRRAGASRASDRVLYGVRAGRVTCTTSATKITGMPPAYLTLHQPQAQLTLSQDTHTPGSQRNRGQSQPSCHPPISRRAAALQLQPTQLTRLGSAAAPADPADPDTCVCHPACLSCQASLRYFAQRPSGLQLPRQVAADEPTLPELP